MKTEFKNIDEYISSFPEDIQRLLEDIRTVIRNAAPDAKEDIKYGMPTYVLGKNLVHFAVNKNHIGFYPAPSGIIAFKDELSVYKTSKGAIQFPLSKPVPLKLITKIVKFRVKENLENFKKSK
jgi:uncharacterized protein YdhG (YjbR/CyaY superfamily)